MPNPIQIYEGFPSRETVDYGENPSETFNWVVLGTSDELQVKELVLATTPKIWDGLFRHDISVKETAPETWDCQAKYGLFEPPAENVMKFSFDTTGGKMKITYPKERIAKYPNNAPTMRERSVLRITASRDARSSSPHFTWSETCSLCQ